MDERNEEWPVIGIDIGTTYSCVGIWQNDRVEIIANDQGNRTTPSWVAFTQNERLIGEAAENQGRINPTNTIFDAKRLIGRRFNDEIVQKDMKLWPFKVIAGPVFGADRKPMVSVNCKGEQKQYSAEEISAMVVMKMKETAEAFLGVKVNNAVVTVPAYFNDSQRQATKDACVIAGLNVMRIINEPTAAAIAYGLDKKASTRNDYGRNVLVFDLGGGTFDVSLVTIENDIFEVKAVGGDAHLGGSDFNNRMVSYFVEDFKRKHGKDVSHSARAMGRLRAACETAKKALSTTSGTTIELEYLFDGIDYSLTITRARFDTLNMDLFRKCIDVVEKCLSDAKMGTSDIDDVLLVGGSTRIYTIQEMLKEFFDRKELSKSINADEAVAQGAAILAGTLSGVTRNNSMVLMDVTPISLGVEVGSGNMSVVIPKNTPIPTRQERLYGALHIKSQTFGATDDRQTSILEIPVYEGERHKAKDNNFLGVFELAGIAPTDGPSSLINVCFDIDTNGILNVSAEDTSSGNRSQITITNRNRLTKTDMDRMKNEAEEYKVQDNRRAQMMEAKNALEAYANDIWGRLSTFGQNVGAKDKKAIMDAVQETFKWIHQNSFQIIDAAMYVVKLEELKSICRPLRQ